VGPFIPPPPFSFHAELFWGLLLMIVGLNPDGSSRGFAHVEFEDMSTAVRVYEANNEEPLCIVGRNVKVDYAPSQNKLVLAPYHKLYVHGFPKDEESLRAAFGKFDANVIDVHLCTHVP